jgi:hypothetical protein
MEIRVCDPPYDGAYLGAADAAFRLIFQYAVFIAAFEYAELIKREPYPSEVSAKGVSSTPGQAQGFCRYLRYQKAADRRIQIGDIRFTHEALRNGDADSSSPNGFCGRLRFISGGEKDKFQSLAAVAGL